MKVILIDAMHLAHRMYYTHLELMTRDKQPTGVLHGVLSNVLALQERYPDWCMVFCWDQGMSWRRKLAPDHYKAKRYPSDARLVVDNQVLVLQKEMLDVLGIRQISIESIEGDDIVGILAYGMRSSRSIEEVLIYSGDRDFYQLIGSKVKVIVARKQQFEIVDSAAVEKRFGVKPVEWNKFRAFAGDSSDGMKAVKGIGSKTAAEMVSWGWDPSQKEVRFGIPTFHSSPKKAAKAKVVSAKWDMVHLCYRMSCIPKTVADIDADKAVKKQLEYETNIVIRNPGRITRPALGKQFTENLTRYELAYCMGKRRQFWLIP